MTAIWRKELKWKDFVYAHRAFFRSKIIKEPSFTLLMPEVLEFYPTAKALFIVRHPLENIRSILNRLKIQPKSKDWGYGAMPREWQNILTGLHVPNSGENYMENLSLRWLRCVELYERSKNRLQLVKYEAFNSDKASELKSICAALGLEVRKAVEPHCDTQFQPKGQEVKDFKEFLGADNYSIVRKICSPAAKQFGYEFES